MNTFAYDLERLLEVLDAYGADLSRWEPDARAAAETAIAADDKIFIAARADALMLDEALAFDTFEAPSIDLEAAILNTAPTPQPSSARGGWRRALKGAFLPRWASAASMACALLVGAGVGYAQTNAATELAVVEALLDYSDTSGDWDTYDLAVEGEG